jgi:hypothetical protein
MSPRSFDPDELERHPEADAAAEELERYAHRTAAGPSPDFADRVMGAVEREPRPRRTLAGWLAAMVSGHGPANRWAQVGVLTATLVLALGGVLAAGELARLVRDASVGTTPSPIVESLSPSPVVTPTPSPEPTPTAAPSGPGESSEPTADSESPTSPGEPETASPSPRASEDHGGGGSETPEPTETPKASDDHSGD